MKGKSLSALTFPTHIVPSFHLYTLCSKVFLCGVRRVLPFSKGNTHRLYHSHTDIAPSFQQITLCIKVFLWKGTGNPSFVKRKGFPPNYPHTNSMKISFGGCGRHFLFQKEIPPANSFSSRLLFIPHFHLTSLNKSCIL